MIRPEYYGKYGELEAARYLQKQGYKLYDVNYRCRFGVFGPKSNEKAAQI